jgi:putative peptidoglycan lipid II flippase
MSSAPQRADHGSMTRSAAVVGGGTLISRVTGLARDVVLAWVLGASLSADAFFAAFRIPNFLRRIFAEGSLSTAFIPVFSDVLTNQGRAPAFRLACLILNWLAPTLVLVSAAGIVFAPEVVSVLTPGWTGDTEKFNLTVTLTRVMFPYILLISVAALAMGVLNAQGHFASPAFAPVLLNLAMIGSGVVASRFLPEPAIGIACGVLLGGLAQILLQLFPLRTRGFRYGLRFSPSDPHLRQVGRLFVPSLVGSTVYQINMVVITVLASLLPQGSLSYLFYADRLMEFPLGVFAIAVGTVALPIMSRHAARGDLNGLREILGFAFRQVSLIMVPATVGLIVLREPLMSVFFQRGRFDPVATQMSAQALLYYSVGLWFVAQIRIVAPAFYALKDTVTPMVAATVSIAANLLLSLALMGPMAHGGLALAISIAAALQLIILLRRLGPRVGGIPRPLLTRALGKVLLSSMLMGIVCWLVVRWVDWLGDTTFAVRAAVLAVSVTTGALCYGLLLFLLRVEDLRHLLRAFLDRQRRGEDPTTPLT